MICDINMLKFSFKYILNYYSEYEKLMRLINSRYSENSRSLTEITRSTANQDKSGQR
jgi:hypothetical protein